MLKTFVLFMVISHKWVSIPTTQEFDTESTCREAATVFLSRERTGKSDAWCVPK